MASDIFQSADLQFLSATARSRCSFQTVKFTSYFAMTALLTASASVSMAAPKKGSAPSDMVGKWRWSSVSMSNYENSTTGAIEGGGGMSTAFTFTKDGRYTFNFYMKVRTYSLVSEANTYSEGTVIWSNGEFILHPTKGHYLSWYGGRKKTDRDMTASERKKNTHWYFKWEDKGGTRVPMMGMSPTILSQFKRER